MEEIRVMIPYQEMRDRIPELEAWLRIYKTIVVSTYEAYRREMRALLKRWRPIALPKRILAVSDNWTSRVYYKDLARADLGYTADNIPERQKKERRVELISPRVLQAGQETMPLDRIVDDYILEWFGQEHYEPGTFFSVFAIGANRHNEMDQLKRSVMLRRNSLGISDMHRELVFLINYDSGQFVNAGFVNFYE